MGAKKTGGTAGRKKAKDSAMAAAMKLSGETRSTGRCPMCQKMVGLDMYSHISYRCGKQGEGN